MVRSIFRTRCLFLTHNLANLWPVTTNPKEKPNTRIEMYDWNRPLFLTPIYIGTYNYDPQFQALFGLF